LISLYSSGAIQLGFTAIFEPLVKEFGWSYAQVSFASSLRGLETGLLVPLAGMLLDKWGANRLIFLGALIGGMGFLLLSQVNTLLMFYVTYILVAVGSISTTSILLMALVSHWFDKNTGLAMGIASSGVAFGGLLLPVIALGIDNFGWRSTVFTLGIGLWVIVLPLSFLLRRKPPFSADQMKGSGRDVKPKSAGHEASETIVRVESTKDLFKTRPFWIISGALFCHVMTVNSVMTHIMPFLSSIEFDRTKAAFMASTVAILAVIGRVGFGWAADHFNKRHVAVLAFALTFTAAALIGFLNTERTWIIILFPFFLGVGWGGAVPMSSTLLIAYYGKTKIGSIIGISAGLMTAGTVIGAPLCGWIYDRFGVYAIAWFTMSIIMAIATVVFMIFLPNAKTLLPVNKRQRLEVR